MKAGKFQNQHFSNRLKESFLGPTTNLPFHLCHLTYMHTYLTLVFQHIIIYSTVRCQIKGQAAISILEWYICKNLIVQCLTIVFFMTFRNYWRVNLTRTLPKTSLKCKFDIIIVVEFSYPSMSGTSLSNCLTASIRASGVEGGPSRDIGKPMATQRTNTSMNTDNRHQCCRRKRTPEKKRNMRKL